MERTKAPNANAYLVYQTGIANVFIETEEKGMVRMMQNDFSHCEAYACGLRDAGMTLSIWHCDKPGDILTRLADWQSGKGDIWSDSKFPPNPNPVELSRNPYREPIYFADRLKD